MCLSDFDYDILQKSFNYFKFGKVVFIAILNELPDIANKVEREEKNSYRKW